MLPLLRVCVMEFAKQLGLPLLELLDSCIHPIGLLDGKSSFPEECLTHSLHPLVKLGQTLVSHLENVLFLLVVLSLVLLDPLGSHVVQCLL